MQNEPQLSAEGKLNILELVDPKVPYSHFVRVLEKYTQEVIATALEEQRRQILSEVEGWLDEQPIYISAEVDQWGMVDISSFRAELRAKLNQLKEEI